MRRSPCYLALAFSVLAWLLSGRGAAADPPGSPADHFLAYKVRPDRSGPAFAPVSRLPLTGALGAGLFDVTAAADLFVPTTTDGDPISDATTHLRAYKIKPSSGEPRFAMQAGVSVVNALGTIRVDVRKPALLLAPSAVSTVATPPVPSGHGVDHYACYAIAVTRGDPRFPKGLRAHVDNALPDPPLSFDVVKPKHLCLPVGTPSGGITNPSGALLCYQALRTKGQCAAGAPANPLMGCKAETDCGGTRGQTSFCTLQPKHVEQIGLKVTSTLGTLQLGTVKETELCMASAASVLPTPSPRPTPSCGDGTLQSSSEGGEECDPPGAIGACPGGLACDATCACPPVPSCGNGALDPGEECDGASGSCSSGGSCGNQCSCIPASQCGDGDVDAGEDCDPPGSIAACAGLGCLAGCRCPTSPPMQIAGRVVEVGGGGLGGVRVRVGSTPLEVTTDAEGYFAAGVGEAEARDGHVLLSATAEGYSQGFERIAARAGVTPQQVRITLQPAAVALTLPDPDGGIDVATPEVRVAIAPEAIPTSNPVAFEVMPLEPSGDELAAFPGSDFLALRPADDGGRSVVPLESVVLVDVRITDLVTGERIGELGSPALVELLLPASRQSALSVGDTIPWWSFDESTGRWVEGGTAEVFLGRDGAKWMRARATHFSWWNVDYPVETHGCVKFRLIAPGSPAVDVTGVLAAAFESSEGGWAAPGQTDGFATADGRTCATMKQGERMRLRVLDGQPRYLGTPVGGAYPLVDDPAQAFEWTSPSVRASCASNVDTQNCEVLGDLLLAGDQNLAPLVELRLHGAGACPSGALTLTVYASDLDGDLPLGVAWSTTYGDIVPGTGDGGEVVAIARWEFPADGPPPAEPPRATVTVTDARGRAVTRSVTVPFDGNCCPVIEEIDAPSVVDPRETPQVALAAHALDPDASGPLTYSWWIGQDGLSGSTVQWTARANGTVWATVSVSDGTCSTERSVPIRVVNAAPVVRVPPAVLVDCNSAATNLPAWIIEPDGDPVEVTWRTSSLLEQTNPSGPVQLVTVAGEEIETTTQWTDGDPGREGHRTLSVSVRDAFGGTTEAQTLVVVANDPIRLSAIVAPAIVAPGSTVALQAVTTAGYPVPSSHVWSADDGALVPAGASAQWTAPANPGRYVVRVEGRRNCASDDAWAAIDVVDDLPTPANPQSCATELRVDPASGTAPLDVQMVAATANAFPGARYLWTFGDGTTLETSENHAAHTYPSAGTRLPSVSVVSTLSAGGQTRTRSCNSFAVVNVASGALGPWTFGITTGGAGLCPGTSLSDGSQLRSAGVPGSNSSGGGSVCSLTRGNFSVSAPFEIVGGAIGADGIAPIEMTGARVVRAQEPSAASDDWVCIRLAGRGPGWVDCDGGTDGRVEVTVDSQGTSPPSPPAWDDSWLTLPSDGGAGAGPGTARLPIALKLQRLAGADPSACPTADDGSWAVLAPFNTALTTETATSRILDPVRCPETAVVYNCPVAATYRIIAPSSGRLKCGQWATQSNVLLQAPLPLLDHSFTATNVGDNAVVLRLRAGPP